VPPKMGPARSNGAERNNSRHRIAGTLLRVWRERLEYGLTVDTYRIYDSNDRLGIVGQGGYGPNDF
jgi:hypothetical protein